MFGDLKGFVGKLKEAQAKIAAENIERTLS